MSDPMPTKALEHVLTLMKKDDELQAEVQNAAADAATIEAILRRVATNNGYTLTADEVTYAVAQLQQVATDGELSDEELDQIVGGLNNDLYGRRTLRC